MRRLVISVLAVAALASCFSPSLPEGLPCSETNRCPGNQRCDLDTGLCSGGTTPVDAPVDVPVDAPVDAPDRPDACAPVTETCNGLDDDCDSETDEGFTSGAACDGIDSDVCLDDTTICNAQGQEICGDTSGDDDLEICNNADEDCDGVNDNGFDLESDELNCGACGTVCQQINGINTCTTGTCRPMCNVGFADCDGNGNNGCELQNTDPPCSNGAVVEMEVAGDVEGIIGTLSGTTERVVRVRVRETVVADFPITASIALTSGPGTNYDLYVFCPNCQATPISDTDDVVEVGRTDVANNDRTFDVMVEVRLNLATASTTCSPWTLTVTGGVGTSNRCAD